jgi:glutamine cyclotransferase
VITSDGTSELIRRDPETLEPRELIKVRCQGSRVRWLNDLAWAGGLVWANVACTSAIVGIDPATGEVTDIIDASAAAERHRSDPQAIMNGIAALPKAAETLPNGAGSALPEAAGAEPEAAEAQPEAGEFLLTGKGWQWIRHVRLVPAPRRVEPARLLESAGRWFS